MLPFIIPTLLICCLVNGFAHLDLEKGASATSDSLLNSGILESQAAQQVFQISHNLHDYTVKIREQGPDICAAKSKQYTGWVDYDNRSMFFWYVESESNPETDPITLWLTGGPGCAGSVGMMLELGPCTIADEGNTTRYNPYNWASNTSMIFLDQPVGTGFSYIGNNSKLTDNSFSAAKDIHGFLTIFFRHLFPDKSSLDFHIAGESYGGRYVPAIAAKIIEENKLNPGNEIPLKSILIGDGFVSPKDTLFGYYDTLCTTNPGVKTPVFNKTRCDIIAEEMPRCMRLWDACYEYRDQVICSAVLEHSYDKIGRLFSDESYAGGRDPFDITRICEVDKVCYLQMDYINTFMNSPKVWKALGVNETAVSHYNVYNPDVEVRFSTTNDETMSTVPLVKNALENGVDVLIYTGKLDLTCNLAGNLKWTEEMQWKGQAEYVATRLEDWHYKLDNGALDVAGERKGVRVDGVRFEFLSVSNSGHMVPLDQPEVALSMYNDWIYRQGYAA